MRKHFYSLLAASTLLVASTSAFATHTNSFHFTNYGPWSGQSVKGLTQYTFNNTDNHLTATATAYNEGTQVTLGALSLDGIGVRSKWGNVSAIQRLETLRITFSEAVNVGTVHLRQWEALDKVYFTVGKTNGSTNTFAYSYESNLLGTNEKASGLGLNGITYLEITGASTTTATFLAGLYDVTAAQTSEVPVPAAAWLFGSAMAGLGLFGRKKK